MEKSFNGIYTGFLGKSFNNGFIFTANGVTWLFNHGQEGLLLRLREHIFVHTNTIPAWQSVLYARDLS
jgi:hypothetical protein